MEQLEDRRLLAADVLAELNVNSNGTLASEYADVPGLTTTITLDEPTVVYLDSRLSLTSSSKNAFSGEVRFAINGVGEETAATFHNPYVHYSWSGTTSSSTVNINPPPTSTSVSSQHNHFVDIPPFSSSSHNHSIVIPTQDSPRSLNVNARDWLTLGPGTYTITLQASADDAVQFDGTQAMTTVLFVTNLRPIASIDSITELRVAGNAVEVTVSATDANDPVESLSYQYRIYYEGESEPVFQGTDIPLNAFTFVPVSPGNYRIEVTVEDSKGGSHTIEQTILIGAASTIEVLFSREVVAVGAVDNDAPFAEGTFHGWEDATGQVWITIDSDLPQDPFDLTFEIASTGTWFTDPLLQSTLSASSVWQTEDDDEARVTTGTLEALDLSSYQVGDRVLLATILWPQDTANIEGVPIGPEGAYPVTNGEHGIQLEDAIIAGAGQTLAIEAEIRGQFAPVIYDADGNGNVGLSDFSQFVSQFGRTVNAENPRSYHFDYDLNGQVGLSDFIYFVQHFGRRKDTGNEPVTLPYLDSQPQTQNRIMSLESEPRPFLGLALEAEPFSRQLLGYQLRPSSLAEDTFPAVGRDAPQTREEVHPGFPAPVSIDADVLDALLQASHDNPADEIEWEEDNQFHHVVDDELMELLL